MANDLRRKIKRKQRIDTEKPDLLVQGMSLVQGEVLRKVLRILKSFTLKSGKLSVGNRDETALIAGLNNQIVEVLKNSDYPFLVENFLPNFDEVDKLNREIHKELNNIAISEVSTKMTAEKRNAISAISNQLAAPSSLKTNITKPIQNILFRNVMSGSTFVDAENELKLFISGDERRGLIEKYVSQIANDALLQYDGAVNQIIQDEFDLDAYRYIPGLVADSRPQCVRWVKDFKGVLPLDILPQEVDWAKKNGQGYSTSLTLTVDNFAIVRGGHNCRHSAIPFSTDTDAGEKLDQALG